MDTIPSPDLLKNLAKLAKEASEMSQSTRAKCGCVLYSVLEKTDRNIPIILSGFNHAIGEPNEIIENGHTVNYIHAEVSVIAQAAFNEINTEGGIMVMTQRPCQHCLMTMAEAGISRVYYIEDYHSKAHGDEFCSQVLMEKLKVTKLEL